MAGLPRTLAAAALAALLPALADAQQVTLERSAASRCLTPLQPGSEPEYPFSAYKHRKGGTVKVELSFSGPETPPVLKVLESTGDADHVDTFVDAVRAHARQLRLPCLRPEDGKVQLSQEFRFTPDHRQVAWSDPTDHADERRGAMLKCVVHRSGSAVPDYPRRARRDDIQGRVVARLTFTAPDQPPRAEIHARASARLLRAEIQDWVEGLRMPCHAGGPLTGSWTYVFIMEGGAYGFKPLTLQQLMAVIRDKDLQAVTLDTTTMACPFDLQFKYQQPFLPNLVGEVLAQRPEGAPAVAVDMSTAVANPARRPLLEWLAGVELDLPTRSLDSVFGDTALVTVPCVKIDLKPNKGETS